MAFTGSDILMPRQEKKVACGLPGQLTYAAEALRRVPYGTLRPLFEGDARGKHLIVDKILNAV